ncbi:hypothetical protein GCM10009534_53550 [Kribbella sandramycini]
MLLVAGCGTAEVGAPAADGRVVGEVSTPPAPQSAKPKPKATPVKTTRKQVVETRPIPFKSKTVTDSSLPKGERAVRTAGVNGTRKLTYEVTYVGAKATSKRLIRQEVSKQPVSQVTVVGTKVEESTSNECDPNYSGCVPIASDVDCSGGKGNGPEYVAGPVEVIGSDIYRLDADSDGIGCEG